MITLHVDYDIIEVTETSFKCDNSWRAFSIHSDDAATLHDILSSMMFLPARLAATVLTAVAEVKQTGQERWIGYEPLRKKIVTAETWPDCKTVIHVTPNGVKQIQ